MINCVKKIDLQKKNPVNVLSRVSKVRFPRKQKKTERVGIVDVTLTEQVWRKINCINRIPIDYFLALSFFDNGLSRYAVSV